MPKALTVVKERLKDLRELMWHIPDVGGSQPNGGFEKERAAGRAITKLLGSLTLDNEQAKLFVRAVSREEHMANAASTRYDIAMQYCSGAIPKAKVVIATAGLVWEQKAHTVSSLSVCHSSTALSGVP